MLVKLTSFLNSMFNRVQLRIKKIIICFGQKTLATIYRIKNEIVTIFSFLHSGYHADLNIFGVKVHVSGKGNNFTYLGYRISQNFIIYRIKFICQRLRNLSNVERCVPMYIWGVKGLQFTFTPQVLTGGRFLTNSRLTNHSKCCVFR